MLAVSMKLPRDTEQKVKELEERLPATTLPAERLQILLDLARETWLALPSEARRYLHRAVAEAESADEQGYLSSAENMLAEISRRAGELAESEQHADRALAAARAAGNAKKEAGAVNLKGKLFEMRGEYDQAAECFEQCRRLSEQAGFLEGVQAALNELGGLYGLRGQPQRALDCYLECLKIDDELGDSYCIALHRYNIGWTLEQLGRWEEAAESLYRTVAISEQHGFRDLMLDAMNVLGELFLKRDNLARAKDMFGAVVQKERDQPGYRALLRDALANLGLAHFRAGELAAAENTYAEALEMCTESGDQRERAILLVRFAELLFARGNLERAEEMLSQAQELCDRLSLARESAEVLRIRGLIAQERGDATGAASSFEQAAGKLADAPDSYELARVRFQYGRCLARSGQPEQARPLLEQAARTFRLLSVVADAEEVNRLLFRLEMPSDAENAVLGAVVGLTRIGLEPVSLFERALRIICEGLEFDHAAIVLGDSAVLLYGRPDLDTADRFSGRVAPVATERYVWIPVMTDCTPPAGIYLERTEPASRRPSPGFLVELIRRCAEPMRRLAELPLRPEPVVRIPNLHYRGVVGRNPKMIENLRIVAQVASASVPVLVKGESGTGKELIARALHDSSVRSGKPFVAVNCAAVPETLLEAEFFGVEKGAATGIAQRRGKFELAHGGTIFLDEIGDMSPALQARLLRVLQDKVVERLGGTRPIDTDVRVVAATNKNLEELMRRGTFRQDLYYRLNAVELEVPALRDRKEDIPAFVRYFVTSSNQEFHRNVLGVDEAAMACLIAFNWPGNIRQLRHVIERAVVLSRAPVLTTTDLPAEIFAASTTDGPCQESDLRTARRAAQKAAADDLERTTLVQCLEKAKGNATEAAKLAGYSRAQFYRLLRKHNLRTN